MAETEFNRETSAEAAAANQDETTTGAAPPPRNWLTPYLLMLLRSWQGYGYELVRQLAMFGFGWVDPGTVYRALRELEREGCVVSHWDTSGGSGPARRVYTITDAGIDALGIWASTFDSYRQMIDIFFQQYNPGGPGAADRENSSPDGKKRG